jgi:hypothetical protein
VYPSYTLSPVLLARITIGIFDYLVIDYLAASIIKKKVYEKIERHQTSSGYRLISLPYEV